MYKTLLIVLTMAIAAGEGNAQITIDASDIPGPGFQAGYHMSESATFSVGSAGANQVWNFGAHNWDSEFPIQVYAPSATPYGSLFPSANSAIDFGGVYLYLNVGSDGMYKLGTVSPEDTSIFSAVFRDPMFPLTYQASWTAVGRWENFAPGWERVDSTVFVVDGWGTLHTPYFDGPVLRKQSHWWTSFGQIGQPPQWADEFLGYQWTAQWGFPAAEAYSPDGVLDPNFTAGELSMVGLVSPVYSPRGPIASSLRVGQNYPNPFNPETRIPLEYSKSGKVDVTVYDELGRVVFRQSYEVSQGSNEVFVEGRSWASGSYFATVSDGIESQTVKMCLVK